MKIKEIIKEYLNNNGYDGLFCPGECACKKDDLMPCDEYMMDCEPGYLIEKKCADAEYDWYIGAKKESKIEECCECIKESSWK